MTVLQLMAKAHWQYIAEGGDFLPQWDELTPRSQNELIGQMRAAIKELKKHNIVLKRKR